MMTLRVFCLVWHGWGVEECTRALARVAWLPTDYVYRLSRDVRSVCVYLLLTIQTF
jgi:hypothetical protein